MEEKNEAGSDPVDVAIVGAGMAGLSAAVYARKAGLSVRVFEKHSLPGGLCTSWERKGYTFDYCIHWLVGSSPKHPLWELWRELGATHGRTFINHEVFSRYSAPGGRSFDLAVDPAKLEANMVLASPEDSGAAAELAGAVRKARKFKIVMGGPGLLMLFRLIPALPALKVMRDYSKLSIQEWCARLKSPFLRDALLDAWGLPDFPMSALIMTLAMMAEGSAGYPLGGSLALAKAVEAKAKSLGADFRYGRPAKRILVEDGRAAGLELEDGGIQRARYVVAACDAKSVFEGLLEGRLKEPAYEEMFARREIFPSLVQVSLGLRADPAWKLDSLPANASFPLGRPVEIDGRARERIGVHHYAYDPLVAPPGGTVILARQYADYDRWKALEESGNYEAEKRRVLAATIEALEQVFPGLGARVEASDVSTPLSCERYTGNWRGCFEGWLITTKIMQEQMKGWRLPKTFPSLPGFYLIGQWTEPGGGLPPAAMNGREAAAAIHLADKERK